MTVASKMQTWFSLFWNGLENIRLHSHLMDNTSCQITVQFLNSIVTPSLPSAQNILSHLFKLPFSYHCYRIRSASFTFCSSLADLHDPPKCFHRPGAPTGSSFYNLMAANGSDHKLISPMIFRHFDEQAPVFSSFITIVSKTEKKHNLPNFIFLIIFRSHWQCSVSSAHGLHQSSYL